MSVNHHYPRLKYGSVCSGIEAATAAWHPLGMEPAWFAEIEPFPSAVLARHYPRTPNLGDMTKLGALVLAGKIKAPDVLVGGTPCQAFSVAGMRQGMLDPRGALTIKYVELADAVDHVRTSRNQPESIIVWENVPGVLSDKGNAFGCFLGALAGEDCELQPPGKRWQDAGCVYGPKRTIAWRILDAQYFGLAQRRRRVFLVASARADFDPTAVLFEREGVRRDTAPRRGEIKAVAALTANGVGTCGADDNQAQAGHVVTAPLTTNQYGDHESRESLLVVAGTLQANGKAAGSATQQDAESGLLVVHGTQDPSYSDSLAFALGRNSGQENVLAFSCKDHGADAGYIAPTLRAMGHGTSHANAGGQIAVCVTGDVTHTLKAEGFDGSEDGTGRGQPIVAAFAENSRSELRYEDGDGGITGALSTGGGKPGQGTPSIQSGPSVRRLTPRECERLQGFPDDYTLIPWRGRVRGLCPDGPRYKAIGNSKAVPVVRWIGMRILEQL
ncbi:Cytosine-specific methyltransferase [Pseudomonas syringae pv. helianthi]|uniref:DNA (cytosine-5-)-methyltransferase n=1 Tax=Pseudomonas syringae pv. helianthi TaxID=251654 RepID=A0A0N8RN75_9PSED|nr:DNA cytosine methyltransferase [Pseudomonas syringae group genomosp. 7]KPX44807.1 Cytosine-specific methyltransferase [Pseudomonas syringae pv. helianthi]UNB61881.1 DNA cytosine methyltransferase [Pseudomonas syringae pv. helianthi]